MKSLFSKKALSEAVDFNVGMDKMYHGPDYKKYINESIEAVNTYEEAYLIVQ